MWYTKRRQLTVIEIDEYTESISMEEIKRILLGRPSNMIYCELQGKLFGIISTGDIYRAYVKRQKSVKINKKFSYINAGEHMKARTIFREKRNINALPVVSEDDILIGDYTRWDDIMLLENMLSIEGGNVGNWDDGQKIMLIQPDDVFTEKQRIFNRFKERLMEQNVEILCVSYSEAIRQSESVDRILVVDENEIRAWGLLFGMMCGGEGRVPKINTYRNIMYPADFSEMCIPYFNGLHGQGIHILGLTFDRSTYYEQLEKKIYDKFASIGEMPSDMLKESMYREFFDDLYSEEYANEILEIPFAVENNGGILCLKDCRSRYYNVANGERQTTGQPENYERSIYFFGRCYIYGHWVEDKNTIESFLQQRLCSNGKAVRVVNCGDPGMGRRHGYLVRIMTTELKKGDIIVIGSPPEGIEGVTYLDLNKTLEKNKVDARYLIDSSVHCNHKVNELYADAIYEALKPVFSERAGEQGTRIKRDNNFIRLLYLDRYFTGFHFYDHKKIGSIVMNCNPFTYGHRFLIEQALKEVDFLIIFVVEEDLSVFSFAERFAMIRGGGKDLNNVMVVPSGPFILSQMSFPEYFIKETSEDIVEHTKQDITTFAEKIAPQLGIRYRFVGEEPEDSVTNQYNLAMKTILPQYGIELIEIPRKTVNGKYISASLVRQYMEENDRDKLVELLPETTRRLIGLEI